MSTAREGVVSVVVVTSLPTVGTGTFTGASLLRRGAVAAGAEAPLRGDVELLESAFAGAGAPRPERRDGDVDFEASADEAFALEPEDPVVSANATGIAATADPTPKAMASAPTRPT